MCLTLYGFYDSRKALPKSGTNPENRNVQMEATAHSSIRFRIFMNKKSLSVALTYIKKGSTAFNFVERTPFWFEFEYISLL